MGEKVVGPTVGTWVASVVLVAGLAAIAVFVVDGDANTVADSERWAPMRQRLDALVADGVLTAHQADSVVERLVIRSTGRRELPGSAMPGMGGKPGKSGMGHGPRINKWPGMGDRPGMNTGRQGGMIRTVLEEASGLLGLDQADLVDRLKAGETLVEVAGDGFDDLVGHLVERRTEQIRSKVASGRLDEARAREIIDGLSARVTERLRAAATQRMG
tara:strand:+ start:380 stop:1027 length:648 start_codon:yes stop_codon:yes gene_type:complete